MKKLLLVVFLLTPTLSFADRLGSLRSSSDVLLTTQAVAGGGGGGGAFFSVSSTTAVGFSTINFLSTHFDTSVTGSTVHLHVDIPGILNTSTITALGSSISGGVGGEITDASVTADDLGTDSVSADELNAAGVEAELEAVQDLQDFQGAVTDGQVPNNITIDLATLATTANAGDSATAFFSAGVIESERLPTVPIGLLTPNATSYIQNSNTLQSGATVYVATGTIQFLTAHNFTSSGTISVNGSTWTGRVHDNSTTTHTGLHTFGYHTPGAIFKVDVKNLSNTASSDAQMVVTSGGSSAGDAFYTARIADNNSWSWGARNSDSDAWTLANAGDLSTNRKMRADTTGVTVTTISVNGLGVGIGVLRIPVDANPTPDTSGSIAIDTTDNQLVYFGATAARVIPYKRQYNIPVANPAAGTYLIGKAKDGFTILTIDCIVDPAGAGESVLVNLQECDSTGDNCTDVDASDITADNDGATDDGALSNATIDAGDWWGIELGTVTGTVSQLVCTADYVTVRE